MVVQIAESMPELATDIEADQIANAIGYEAALKAEDYILQESISTRCDSFVNRAVNKLGALIMANGRHEAISIKAMTGEVTIYDYDEGVFGLKGVSNIEGSADDLRAYVLRCVAFRAAVQQTDIPKKYNPETETGDVTYLITSQDTGPKETNETLRSIENEAIRLHFELRTDRSVQEIRSEIEEHIQKLIFLERSTVAFQKDLPDFSSDKKKTAAKQPDEMLSHSQRRIRKLQSVLFHLVQNEAY